MNRTELAKRYFSKNKNLFRSKDLIDKCAAEVGLSKRYTYQLFYIWLQENREVTMNNNRKIRESKTVIRCSNGNISRKFRFDDSRLFKW